MYDPREEGFTVEKARVEVPSVRRSQRTLTVEDVAARRAEARESAVLKDETAAVVTVPARSVRPADPAVALRHARLGFFAALALVLVLIWMMQRRKESVR